MKGFYTWHEVVGLVGKSPFARILVRGLDNLCDKYGLADSQCRILNLFFYEYPPKTYSEWEKTLEVVEENLDRDKRKTLRVMRDFVGKRKGR